MLEKRTIDISTGVVFRTVIILLGIWFLYLVRNIIAILFISIIIVSAIEPAVNWMQKKKIPRSAGVSLIYVALFSLLGLVIFFLVPPIFGQIKDFSQKFPYYIQGVENYLGGIKNFLQKENIGVDFQQLISDLSSRFALVPEKILAETIGVFSGILSFVIILVMAFYMTVKEDGIKKFIVSIVPEKHKEYAESLTERIKSKIGKWLQGQVLLMLIVFALDFAGLYLIGIPYTLILAIFAGILEIVPYIGPIVSAVPGVVLGFTISPLTGLMTLLMYWIVQQFENHIIVPQVMKKTVGLNPIAVILALLIGAKLGGVLGAILSIPVATVISVFVGDLMGEKEKANQN